MDNIWLTNYKQAYKLAVDEWSSRGVSVEPIPGLMDFSSLNSLQLNTIDYTQRSKHLTHEARLAKYASIRYLMIMNDILNPKKLGTLEYKEPVLASNLTAKNKTQIDKILNKKLFNGNNGLEKISKVMEKGIMRCDLLKEVK